MRRLEQPLTLVDPPTPRLPPFFAQQAAQQGTRDTAGGAAPGRRRARHGRVLRFFGLGENDVFDLEDYTRCWMIRFSCFK